MTHSMKMQMPILPFLKIHTVALFLAFMSACLVTPSAALAQAEGLSEFKLANGMTLIVKPDHRAPTVAHMLWVGVGAMDEVDGTSGLALSLIHI